MEPRTFRKDKEIASEIFLPNGHKVMLIAGVYRVSEIVHYLIMLDFMNNFKEK